MPTATHYQAQMRLRVQTPKERLCPFEFALHRFKSRRCQCAIRRCPLPVRSLARRSRDFRSARGLDNERAWRNQARNFCVTELVEKRPDIPVYRFFPEVLPGLEISAYQRGAHPFIQRPAIEGDESALAVAG